MRIGILGTGTMGRNHDGIYSNMKSVDQVRVFDLNRAAVGEVEEKNGIVATDSANDLIRHIDTVNICVPIPHHLRTAIMTVLKHGVHMLLEKPVCQMEPEAWQHADMGPDGIICGVEHIERFNLIVSEIKIIIRWPLYAEVKRLNPSSARIIGRRT